MQKNNKFISAILIYSYLIVFAGCTCPPIATARNASNVTVVDKYTLAGDKHFVREYSPIDSSGNINVVVEIPTGTTAKWETDKTTGKLMWEFKNGKPRVVSYLGYPGNYGMIPQTLLPKKLGGDGDPLDVLIIGPAIPRGSIVKARVIGVLKLLDGGEQDDKIVAVLPNSDLGKVSSIEELNKEFKGITNIIEVWFSNYKGPGKMQSQGFARAPEAQKIIKASIEAYSKRFSPTK
ncbi:MAG: inorganic diphosphatase [Candidatus Electrothrix sp. AX5]|nr:inorganic diphosphatase [Candidatus Electrothrix sp. AX5]